MQKTAMNLILLAGAAVNQTSVTREQIEAMDLEALYHLAFAHQMTSIVACVLEEAGVENERFMMSKLREDIKVSLLDSEREAVLKALTEAEIWHMTLKGVYMRNYYPRSDMRQMVDNDILYDASREKDISLIMESLGFTKSRKEVPYEDDFWKRPLCHFEMHTSLFSPFTFPQIYKYYADIRERLLGDGYELYFSYEDFYIYMIAHNYKHLQSAGVGLRALLDEYVYLKRFSKEMDWSYINAEMQKIGVYEYEKRERDLSQKIFEGENLELTAEEQEQLDYYLRSGAYGTIEQCVNNRVKNEGFAHYIRRRIILPDNVIKVVYPFFYEHKLLLPFLPFYRLFHGWREVKDELKVLIKHWRTGRRRKK